MSSQAGPSSAASREKQETEELLKFREAWKAELEFRKLDQASAINIGNLQGIQPGPSSSQTIGGSHAPSMPIQLGHSFKSAVEVHHRTVTFEQQGTFDDGQAFLSPTGQAMRLLTRSPADAIVAKDLSRQLLSMSPPAISGNLTSLLKDFPKDLSFQPENEKEPVFLQTLPEELLVLILRKLDPTSIERFATVSRKARVIGLDSAIWREIVETTYLPPQIPDAGFLNDIVAHYMLDFRRLYVEYPRVRTDGVYIAICHYVRQGLSENSWINITHHITYHRYLRFYPNGQVLSLLTNEDHNPPSIIPLLKPTLQMKGLFIGTWSLSGTAVHIQNLIEADKHASHAAAATTSATMNDTSSMSYSYQMILEIRSRPLGRWNRLQIICYDSVELGSGEVVPIALKHERPLWFSKVRSYAH